MWFVDAGHGTDVIVVVAANVLGFAGGGWACGRDRAQRDTREVPATGMTNSGAGHILYALLGQSLLRLVPYNQVYLVSNCNTS